MNVNNYLARRRLGLSSRIDIDFAIDQIKLKEAIKLTSLPNPEDQELKSYGPLACARLKNDVLAVANEDGFINLLNTKHLKDLGSWLGHENAIFDMKASADRTSILTASGDASIKRWDVETKKLLTELVDAHQGTIKSLSVYDKNVFASGSRDGSIHLYDLRNKQPLMLVITDAHRNILLSRKTRKSDTKTDPKSSVTNVTFDPNFPRIYSTGANDATIKLWDIRKQTQAYKRKSNGLFCVNSPVIEVVHPAKGKVFCGYSHLLLSSYKVYAACSDNKIYCYENFGSDEIPKKFTGFSYDSYLKLAIMDDRFLFSGAKRGGALMWTLGNKCSSKYYPETTKQPIGQLKPDNDNDKFDTNVIDTDWESLSIITFRDDRLVCKWSMQHVLDSEKEKLQKETCLQNPQQEEVTIEMSDIIDVNVLRPNQRLSNGLFLPMDVDR